MARKVNAVMNLANQEYIYIHLYEFIICSAEFERTGQSPGNVASAKKPGVQIVSYLCIMHFLR